MYEYKMLYAEPHRHSSRWRLHHLHLVTQTLPCAWLANELSLDSSLDIFWGISEGDTFAFPTKTLKISSLLFHHVPSKKGSNKRDRKKNFVSKFISIASNNSSAHLIFVWSNCRGKSSFPSCAYCCNLCSFKCIKGALIDNLDQFKSL